MSRIEVPDWKFVQISGKAEMHEWHMGTRELIQVRMSLPVRVDKRLVAKQAAASTVPKTPRAV
jgi:hypothetical protein